MKKIGLLTFHGAHNYGSVLQAFATAKCIEKYHDYDCEIINYRPKTQRDFYSLFPKLPGVKGILLNLYNLIFIRERKTRFLRFEYFISNKLPITEEYYSREDLIKADLKYDVYLSGSDQIWSDNVAENANSEGKNTGVYFWDFIKEGNKRAYAPSVGSMNYEQISKKADIIKTFSYLSTREEAGSDMIIRATGMNVDTVLDPTFLLEASEWDEISEEYHGLPTRYMLLYTVGTRKRLKCWIKELRPIAKKRNLKLLVLSPLFSYRYPGVEFVNSAGPSEFLYLFSKASCIVADSFHGTAFSIIYRKPFYVLGNKYHSRDIRKINLLNYCGLEAQMIEKEAEVRAKDFKLDYSKVESLIQDHRKKSIECFEKAIDYTIG